jgi:hypothetical protein
VPPLEPAVDTSSLTFVQERIRAGIFASLHGYFWLPCPLCGIDFGGHEWRDGEPDKPSHIPDPGGIPGLFKGICPYCTEAGRGSY